MNNPDAITPAVFAEAQAEKRHDDAREMAQVWVKANARELEAKVQAAVRELRLQTQTATPTLAELVQLVDVYRSTGDEESRVLVDMWIAANHDLPDIVGSLRIGSLKA